MNHLEPLWLQSFVAIAATGAVARAAQRVHRTPSAVSTHLQKLEAAVGARLVERTTRSLRLTAQGERFLPFAERLLELQEAAQAAVKPAPQQGVWRVGISEYFLPHRLQALLALLEREAAGARLELSWASSAELQRRWQAGDADVVVVTASEPLPDARLLRREPLAWVVGGGFRPPSEGAVPLVLLGSDCPVRAMALGALARSGRAHALRLTCSGSQAAVAAVRAGWGVGCLNASAVPPDLVNLAQQDARRWRSPGRLSFYGLARPAFQRLLGALAAWTKAA
ncbi:LysR family transcriptional regulator [Sorangium sp. So ce131]|uniref:LysR family transcriptional regulator n=1 Tax=Sorangium sp. So ce131 TaxID=3133282 RepID=UPI003F63F650